MKITRMMKAALLPLACLVLTLSARAAAPAPNLVEYLADDGTTHTIHWTQGITPPTMPGQMADGQRLTREKADMKLINGLGKLLSEPQENSASDYEEYYVSAYLPGNGWYDLNKIYQETGLKDTSMCFAMSALNNIHWWLDQNESYIVRYLAQDPQNDPALASLDTFRELYQANDPSAILQNGDSSPFYPLLLQRFAPSGTGGFMDVVEDFFFNGYARDQEDDQRALPDRFVPAKDGGFFYPVFGKSILSYNENRTPFQDVQRDLADYLDSGAGISIALSYWGGSAHAITLWGAEYDADGQLCALYVTDNNDKGTDPSQFFGPNGGTGPDAELISMIRYQIYEHPEDHRPRVTTLKNPNLSGSKLLEYFVLTPAQEGWEAFFETGKPLYEDGRAFLHPIIKDPNAPSLGKPGCSHSFVYHGEGRRIVQTCENEGCDFRQWIEGILKEEGPYVYNGSAYQPYRISTSPQWGSNPFYGNWTYRDNVDAGQATATMSAKGASVTFHFTIEPAEQEAPLSAPQVLTRDSHSVTLQTEAGLEYSYDKVHWQTDGRFRALTEDTAYQFYARRAAVPNYKASAPSPAVSVRTDPGEPLPPDGWQPLEISSAESGGAVPQLEVSVRYGKHGAEEAAALLLAGYDEDGRQLWARPVTVRSGCGETAVYRLTLENPPASLRSFRAFLLGPDALSQPLTEMVSCSRAS